ncbi:MAG TPA: helix-turn-helix domain-containing protein [Solirubrobacteraceae bacterium]|nr:helix-turn-helix domain-containing protein [Solirubrobacteraceae bacterium]
MPAEPYEPELSVLGRAIRELRERAGLGVGELATAADIPEVELASIEAGRLDPGYLRLRRLAAALGVEETTLLLRVGELEADDSD